MKRKAEESLVLRVGFLKEVKLSTKTSESHILFFQRNSSILLRPFKPIQPEDLRTIFAYRSYRTISTINVVGVPDIDLSRALVFLEDLSERYKNLMLDTHPLLIDLPSQIPRKEQRLELAAKYLLANQHSLSFIATQCSLKKSHVQSLSKRLQTHGTILPTRTHRPKLLTWEHNQFINSLLACTKPGEMTLCKIKKELQERFEEITTISLTTISKALHSEGFSYKRIVPYVANRNFDTTKTQRIQVGLKLIAALHSNYTVIFVDETSVHLGINPDYGWGLKGEKLLQKNPAKRDSFSVVTAITDKEVLGCVVLQGGMTQDDYCGFLCTLIRNVDSLNNNSRIVIYADNLRAHKTELINEVIGQNTNLLFNASYSPMLNPIEVFFSKFKRLIKGHTCNTEKQVITAIQESMESFTTNDFNGYMRNTIKNLYKSFEEQNL